MGFDLYSFDAPGAHQASVVKKYFRAMHQSGNLSPFDLSLATNLHTQTNVGGWSKLVGIIERCVDDSVLDAPTEHRCYKPDEQNYSLFVGDEFRPKGMPPAGPGKEQLMSIIGGSSDGEIIPDYSRCAACTKPNAGSRCAKCKVVKYCGRDCQGKHWKSCHKKICTKAEQNFTLRSVLNGGNDYLHITSEECAAIAKGLKNCREKSDPMVKNFFAYFDSVAQLGGCFVG